MRDHALFGVVPNDSLPMGLDAQSTPAYLQALFVYSPVAIVALDSKHRFVMCNPAFESLFQFSPDELARTSLDDLIAGPDMTQQAHDLSRSVLQGERVHTVAQRRRKDGAMLDVEVYGIPLVVNGLLSGVYGLYQDVTERNHAQLAFRELAHLMETVQEKEQRRIARELHDSTSQELAVLNWNLTLLTKMVQDSDPKLRELIAQTKEIAQQCSSHIRSASYLMHPPRLSEDGLAKALKKLATEFQQRSGLRMTINISDIGRFPEEVEITLFRVLQEGLANVLRHSGSSVVHLSLSQSPEALILAVADEGRQTAWEGSYSEAIHRCGVGFSGMHERLEQLGGSLVFRRTEVGTTLTAVLPI